MEHLRSLQEYILELEHRNSVLEQEVTRDKELTQVVESQCGRLERLKRGLKALYESDNEAMEIDERGSDPRAGVADWDNTISEDTDEDVDDGSRDPIYDAADEIYRCSDCSAELEPNYLCIKCGIAHDVPEDAPEIWNQSDDVEAERYSGERSTKRRGTTPLLDCNINVAVPAEFEGTSAAYTGLLRQDATEDMISDRKKEEFTALLRRGANHTMISAFQLSFSDEHGIKGYANEDILEEWAGPGMKEGDVWSFLLGRRIHLDKYDHDGSLWMHDFLENAIAFPELGVYAEEDRMASVLRFETVSLGPGVWVTRPIDPEVTNQDASNLPPDIFREDAYEVDPVSDDEILEMPAGGFESWPGNYDSMSDSESEAGNDECSNPTGSAELVQHPDEADEMEDEGDIDSSSEGSTGPGSGWDSDEVCLPSRE